MTTDHDPQPNSHRQASMGLTELIDAAVRAKGSRAKVAMGLRRHPQRLTDWKARRSTPNATDIAYLAECAGLPPIETLAEIAIQLDPRCVHIWADFLDRMRRHSDLMDEAGHPNQATCSELKRGHGTQQVEEEKRPMTLRALLDAASDVKGSCRALASSLGRNPHHISDWKAGRRRPSTGEIAQLAEYVGLPIPQTIADVESSLNERYSRMWRSAIQAMRQTASKGSDATFPKLSLAEVIDQAVRESGGRRVIAEGLGQDPQRLTDWKAGRRQPDVNEVAYLATCAGLPVMEAVADIQAQRDLRHESLWRRVLSSIRTVVGVCGFATALLVSTTFLGSVSEAASMSQAKASVSANQMRTPAAKAAGVFALAQ